MMNTKTSTDYLKLPYTREIVENEDGTFFIKVKELPGCMTEADTLDEAYQMIKDAMKAWIDVAIEDSQDIPLPESMNKEYSGKIPLRLPKSLHKTIVENAKKDGVSINTYLVSLIAREDAISFATEAFKRAFCRGASELENWATSGVIMEIPVPNQDLTNRPVLQGRTWFISGGSRGKKMTIPFMGGW